MVLTNLIHVCTHIQYQFLPLYQFKYLSTAINEKKFHMKLTRRHGSKGSFPRRRDLHRNNMAEVITRNRAVTSDIVNYDR